MQYINTTYRRTGTLWDSRYKSSLIQAETYLLACQRYIELSLVRAAMVDDPAHYHWTSYRHNALGQASPYLTPHPLYLAIGRGDTERQAAYRDLFRSQLDNKAIDDPPRAQPEPAAGQFTLLCQDRSHGWAKTRSQAAWKTELAAR